MSWVIPQEAWLLQEVLCFVCSFLSLALSLPASTFFCTAAAIWARVAVPPTSGASRRMAQTRIFNVLAVLQLARAGCPGGPSDVCDGGASDNVAMLQGHRHHGVASHRRLLAMEVNTTRQRGRPRVSKGAFSEVATGAEFQINEDGVWNTYFLPGANIIDKRTVEYGINDKYYLMKYDTTDTCKAGNFEMLKLPGKTITATVFLNGAGCGCNVNFFLVAMPASSLGEYGDCYCDANCVGGNCCNELRRLRLLKEKPPALQFPTIQEFDLNEMNTHAVQACVGVPTNECVCSVTNHLCGDPPTHETCDGNGSPVMNFSPNLFGPGNGNTIDTEHPFNYSVQFQEVIYSEHNPDNHLVVAATIRQGDKVVTNTMANAALTGMWSQLASGMVLVFDYWQSSDMTWLDGASCQAPESCSGNKAQVSNMHISTNA
ncbi:egl1 [Symbiodinium sp. CCMP2592]|nr:egl1 [Symbiodinium sp. CCMP2592]